MNYIKCISILALPAALLVFAHPSRAENSNSTIIENNVSSSANSSGNSVSGPGEIKTGNASAESNVSTKINGGGESKVEVNAKAEANGKKVETNVKAENPNENINIRKEVHDENSNAKVDVNIGTGEKNPADISQESNTETQNGAVAQSNNQENNNFFTAMTHSVSESVKNIFNKIISLFG